MSNYMHFIDFTAAIILMIMAFLVYENSRFDKETKHKFYMTYLVIFVAMFGEWAGLMLNGNMSTPIVLHIFVKCMDYIFTPSAGVLIIAPVAQRDRVQKFMEFVIGVNTLFQVISAFTGWTFYVDAQNIYHHGPIYNIYVITYLLTIVGVLTEFYLYGKQYTEKRYFSLYAIGLLLLIGVLIQETFDFRISYLTLTICAALLFIHYSEFSQITIDKMVEHQKGLLYTDVLTGLYSRYAYTNDLKELENPKNQKDSSMEGLVIFSVDVNQLKEVNDKYGHLAGDELIKGAAICLKKVFGNYGKCYRTGGDEFIALLYMNGSKAYSIKSLVEREAEQWHGSLVDHLSLSVGYAIAAESPSLGIERLINLADEKMYDAKAHYYLQTGEERKKRNEKVREALSEKEREYVDIISALSDNITGLYVIELNVGLVTAYRVSASDHNIRIGVPLQQGFEAAMNRFIDKVVHPDDKEIMRRGIQLNFIKEQLKIRDSFTLHFRSYKDGEIHYHYMKCLKNRSAEAFDKIIISFSTEDNEVSRKKILDLVQLGGQGNERKILVVMPEEEERKKLCKRLSQSHQIVETASGHEAIDIIKNNPGNIAIVLYDRSMPGINALQFLMVLNRDYGMTSLQVIILNDHNRTDIDKRYFEYGAIDFVQRPYDLELISRRIDNIMRLEDVTGSLDEIEVDELTGLYTRQAFFYRAKRLLNGSPDEEYTILISDIQNFKMYNDVHGIEAGNTLLKIMTGYIKMSIINGIYGRYGADQFVAIIKSSSMPEILRNLELIQTYMNQITKDNIVLKFGLYENVDRSLEVSQMCDNAIQALKSIKHTYDHSYALFDGPVAQKQMKKQFYESNFKYAIDHHEFEVWYQPKYNSYTEKVVGAEALIRWHKEDGEYIYPSEFLPVFEADGLISRLDEYVFCEVCHKLKKWKDAGQKMIPISVNLSRNSMHISETVKRYRAIVDECGLDPKMIPIEITESAAKGTKEIKPLADAFYEAGFSLHMDDFGSENSSLAGLNVLHFDVVKLDKSLVDYIGDPHGNLVLMYTVALGKELGLHLVAEGVESKEQLEYLKEIGCEVVQGFYFSRPLPEDEFETKIADCVELADSRYDLSNKLTVVDSLVKRAMDRMLHRMPGGFLTYSCDEEEHIISSNQYLWNLYGCKTEEEFMEHVGGSFKGMVAPENLLYVEQYIKQQIAGTQDDMDYVEYDIVKKDGSRVAVVDYGHLDRQPDGDVFYVFISEKEKFSR